MNDYIPTVHQPAGGTAGRPGTLLAAILSTALAAASMLVTAAVSLIAGRSLLRDYLREELGAEIDAAAVDSVVEAAFGSLQARAYAWLFFGAVFGLLLVPVKDGRTWGRIVLSVVAPVAVLLGLRDLTDMVSPITGVLAALAALGALAALVTCWLPATNRHVRTRGQLRRSQSG
ncbi:hypothetical protein [Planobispora longispora]|uniref:Uncharacterized protein n=1 Tax=Planobispora longispora TaxID=28887 RepID=A0A8J3RK55_9ACTN|nr:hypothetical protein [Planobispora longispora]GIH76448.1 hypothetical protein Plo01_28770 [Planobispora longispora]